MNIYIETCRRHLRDIAEGRLSYESHLEALTRSIRRRIQEADEVIVCGLSPLGRKCAEYIGSYTQAPIMTYDLRDVGAGSLRCIRGGYRAWRGACSDIHHMLQGGSAKLS